MCISPITIRVRCPKGMYYDTPSYLRIYRKAVDSPVYRDIIPGAYQMVTVPCGKCVECLRRRQADIAVRCQNEAVKRGSMVFVTLTYNPVHLPFSSTIKHVDTDTGELTYEQNKILCSGTSVRHRLDLSESMLHISLRDAYSAYKPGIKPLYVENPFFRFDSVESSVVFTPSVCRKDFQLWLKSSRVAFEREFGHKLPEFSYLACQEYGPKTCRPHFHALFFGLPKKTVCWLAARWSSKKCLDLGYSQVKEVPLVNNDGSPGYSICARYVSKYCSKGFFECESVKEGFAQKPRLMLSRGLGMSISRTLIDYYRCDDVLGSVDIMSLKFKSDGKSLSVSDLKFLAEEVKKRNYILIPGKGDTSYKCCLPKSYIRQIWYVYDENTKSFRASPLRKALSLFTYSDPLEEYLASLKADYPGMPEGFYSDKIFEFEAGLQANLLARKKTATEYLRKQYCKSCF